MKLNARIIRTKDLWHGLCGHFFQAANNSALTGGHTSSVSAVPSTTSQLLLQAAHSTPLGASTASFGKDKRQFFIQPAFLCSASELFVAIIIVVFLINSYLFSIDLPSSISSDAIIIFICSLVRCFLTIIPPCKPKAGAFQYNKCGRTTSTAGIGCPGGSHKTNGRFRCNS